MARYAIPDARRNSNALICAESAYTISHTHRGMHNQSHTQGQAKHASTSSGKPVHTHVYHMALYLLVHACRVVSAMLMFPWHMLMFPWHAQFLSATPLESNQAYRAAHAHVHTPCCACSPKFVHVLLKQPQTVCAMPCTGAHSLGPLHNKSLKTIHKTQNKSHTQYTKRITKATQNA